MAGNENLEKALVDHSAENVADIQPEVPEVPEVTQWPDDFTFLLRDFEISEEEQILISGTRNFVLVAQELPTYYKGPTKPSPIGVPFSQKVRLREQALKEYVPSNDVTIPTELSFVTTDRKVFRKRRRGTEEESPTILTTPLAYPSASPSALNPIPWPSPNSLHPQPTTATDPAGGAGVTGTAPGGMHTDTTDKHPSERVKHEGEEHEEDGDDHLLVDDDEMSDALAEDAGDYGDHAYDSDGEMDAIGGGDDAEPAF